MLFAHKAASVFRKCRFVRRPRPFGVAVQTRQQWKLLSNERWQHSTHGIRVADLCGRPSCGSSSSFRTGDCCSTTAASCRFVGLRLETSRVVAHPSLCHFLKAPAMTQCRQHKSDVSIAFDTQISG